MTFCAFAQIQLRPSLQGEYVPEVFVFIRTDRAKAPLLLPGLSIAKENYNS